MESILETKAATILEFFAGLRGTLSVTFEEGTWAVWLYDLLKPQVAKLVVCNPRKNALLKHGNKSDRIDVRKLADPAEVEHIPWFAAQYLRLCGDSRRSCAVPASGVRWRGRSGNRWLGGIQRRMSLSELTLGKIVQRFFLYIGIALAVLVVCAVAAILKDPVLSPFFADLHGMPPTLFMTSTRDMMLSDTTILHRAFLRAGVDASLVVFEGLNHCFPYDPNLPESGEADGIMANFFDTHLGTK